MAKTKKGKKDLVPMLQENRLLRALEDADRSADPNNCPKSLRQKDAIVALDMFRGDNGMVTNPKVRRLNPAFEEIGTSVGKLVTEKNAAYGDAFAQSGKILRVLYPDGVKPDQYEDLLGICRVLDKLFRIAWAKDAFGESPWKDVAGYGILGVARDQGRKK